MHWLTGPAWPTNSVETKSANYSPSEPFPEKAKTYMHRRRRLPATGLENMFTPILSSVSPHKAAMKTTRNQTKRVLSAGESGEPAFSGGEGRTPVFSTGMGGGRYRNGGVKRKAKVDGRLKIKRKIDNTTGISYLHFSKDERRQETSKHRALQHERACYPCVEFVCSTQVFLHILATHIVEENHSCLQAITFVFCTVSV